MAQGIQIGKVAEQTGLSIDTIRFYQKIGLVKQSARSEGGFRLFSETEIGDLVFIQKAQELGFSLTEIKQLSVLNQQHDHACSQVRGLLISKLKRYCLSCRTYLSVPTRSGVPSSELIRLALNERRASHDSCCQTNPAASATP